MGLREDLAEANRIFECRVGSNLFGLVTETSDEDFMGIYIPPLNHYFGLTESVSVDLSLVSKLPSGKNAPDAVDRTFYTLKKFVRSAMENTPHAIESLFVNRNNLIFANEIGQELLQARHQFVHMGLSNPFFGIARETRRTLYASRTEMEKLTIGIEVLKRYKPKEKIGDHVIDILHHAMNPVFTSVNEFIKCEETLISLHESVGQAIKKLEKRRHKFADLPEANANFGYDVKKAAHMLRFFLEAEELYETGELQFPLRDAPLLRQVRAGEWSLHDVVRYSEEAEARALYKMNSSKLPVGIPYQFADELLIKLTKKYFGIQL